MTNRQKSAMHPIRTVISAFYIIGFPFLIAFGIGFAYILNDEANGGFVAPEDYVFVMLFWSVIIIPLVIFIHGIISRRRLLKRITTMLRTPQFFWPKKWNYIYHEGEGKYFGIDTENGTILYVHKIRKGVVDVVGLTMSDWTNREVEGKMLRLYTKFPDLPRIEIHSPLAQQWFDTLGAMQYKTFSTPLPFREYVADHLETIERNCRVQVPQLA